MANQPQDYDLMLTLIDMVFQTISRQLAVLPFTAVGGRPYVEMIPDNTNAFQLLTIGVDEYVVPMYHYHGTVSFDFGNNWRIRAVPITFANGQVLYMVHTNFPLGTDYSAMFSYGLHGSSGAQSRLIANGYQMCLYVIDETLYNSLKRQCITWGQFRSLTYQLIRSAHGCIVLARILFLWIGQNDVPMEEIEDLRTNIHLLGNACVDRLEHSIELDLIYKCAIERKRSMPELIPPGGALPPIPIDQFPVIANLVQPQPFNGHNIDVDQFQNTANNFIDNLLDHPLFDRQWNQTFDRLANENTSIPLNNDPALYHIILSNGHEFDVDFSSDLHFLENENQFVDFFRIESQAFTDTVHNVHRLRRKGDDWPPAWLAERLTNHFWVPLHSHGLAGSHPGNNEIISGNNGCQVMTLRFDGIHQLAEQRIYFVNRAMAQELLNLFEVQDVMTQYHQWFQELLPLTRQLCDLRRMSRQVNHDPELLELVNELSEQLFTIDNLLFQKYEYLVRLEQIWKYGLLVANTANGELPVRPIRTKVAIYGVGPSNRLVNYW